MHRDLPVGLLALIVSTADLLSLQIGVGCSDLGIPSSASTDRMHFAFSTAVTAAMSLASMELRVVIDCALD